MKTTREINALVREATSTGKNVYAKGLAVNTLGMISEAWIRVIRAKKLYGEVHCRTLNNQPPWARVLETTEFDIR